jgi:hypothetical protein
MLSLLCINDQHGRRPRKSPEMLALRPALPTLAMHSRGISSLLFPKTGKISPETRPLQTAPRTTQSFEIGARETIWQL